MANTKGNHECGQHEVPWSLCPGACDRGYFRGEGREAGKVRNVAGESAWENLRQDLLLLVRKID
jgi:hypothetical protein